MVAVTQDFNDCRLNIKAHKFRHYLSLWVLSLVLYALAILSTNSEQGPQNMSWMRTPQESEFLKYFRRVNKRSIDNILSRYRSTGPVG
jgi:hypothetical protein